MADKAEKKIYTKNDIAIALADTLGITKSEAVLHVNEVFEILAEIIQKSNIGDDIKLGNIGVITTRMTKAGERRNPRTQEKVKVESKRVAKFRVLPKYRKTLNGSK